MPWCRSARSSRAPDRRHTRRARSRTTTERCASGRDDTMSAMASGASREPTSRPDEDHDLPAPFGKYLLTERLALGGMAEIYLAKLTGPGGFEKQLVIKQIH